MLALLALEDGRTFSGRSFGFHAPVGAEVVFCTAMTGYQEVLSDPSYNGQIVVFTSPHVGNYGMHTDHDESARPWATGIIVRDLCETPSHSEANEGLRHFVRRHRMCGMTGVDTRALTLHLRRYGAMRGYFTTNIEDPEGAVAGARAVAPIAERALVDEVSTVRALAWGSGETPNSPHVVVIDYGVKWTILNDLRSRGCRVTVVPAGIDPDGIDRFRPDGVVLSNGPGDPEALTALLPSVRHVIDRYPVLAICLGHQLAGLAVGARIRKLPFGHHGANHPVKDLRTGLVSITSQNHNYTIDPSRLPSEIEITQVNLNDDTVEGFHHRAKRLWSYQFHPEGAPGPHDSKRIFDAYLGALSEEVPGRAS